MYMCLPVFSFLFFFFLMIRRPPRSTRTDTLFPYTTLFRSALSTCAAWNIISATPITIAMLVFFHKFKVWLIKGGVTTLNDWGRMKSRMVLRNENPKADRKGVV